MGLEFTNLHYFKTNKKSKVDPDEQVRQFITMLKGRVKENWQVLAPNPSERVIYFELEGQRSMPEHVRGSGFEARNEMLKK